MSERDDTARNEQRVQPGSDPSAPPGSAGSDRASDGQLTASADPSAPDITAPGEDLSAGGTHGVGPGGEEHAGLAPGERADEQAPAAGIGGATAGDPVQHPHDPALPPTGSGAQTGAGPDRKGRLDENAQDR